MKPPTPVHLLALLACVLMGAGTARAAADSSTLGLHSDTEGPVYLVGAVRLNYASAHPLHPSIPELEDVDLALGESSDGYVGPRRGGDNVWFGLLDIERGAPIRIYASGIRELNEQFVRELNRRGLVGVFVAPHPDDIDPQTGADLRPPGRTTLELVVYTGFTEGLRTYAVGPAVDEDLDDSPSQAQIRRNSPVQPIGVAGRTQGDPLFRGDLDRYLAFLNRHPGRRVDVSVTPTRTPGGVYVDYLVAEDKPWSVYAQAANTGTDQTTDWRQRFGFMHSQLTGRDDVLRLDYVTGDFDDVHAVVGSYELPLPWFGRTRLRTRALWAEYTSSQFGLNNAFEGEQWNAEAELVRNVYQAEDLFVDATLGARFMNIETTQHLGGDQSDEDDYFVPRLGLEVERIIDTQSLVGFAGLERNLDSVAGTDASELELGRIDLDDDWMRFLWNGSYSFYLEPILNGRAFHNPKTPSSSTLAHEIFLRTSGQFSLGTRLIPQAQAVLGGFYTVRGYPEALMASDNALLFSAEYRYHWPRSFPLEQQPRDLPLIGAFRVAPQRTYGRPDWDLVLRGFYDWARGTYTDEVPGEESETLSSLGVGVELVLKRYLSLRMDYGIALSDARDAESGDTETHLLATFRY